MPAASNFQEVLNYFLNDKTHSHEIRTGIATGIILLFTSIAVITVVKPNIPKEKAIDFTSPTAWLNGCIKAPILEESLFRKLLMPGIIKGLEICGIQKTHAQIGGLIGSSLLFGAAHTRHPIQKLTAFTGGMLFGALTLLYDGKIKSSIAAHATNNTVVFILGVILQKYFPLTNKATSVEHLNKHSTDTPRAYKAYLYK